MPVPRLPLEIIADISDLAARSSTGYDTHSREIQTLTTGSAISLVCRSWTHIGQSLCWRRLDLKISTFPSLLRHLTAHPHLARFVRAVRQYPLAVTDHGDGRCTRPLSEAPWIDALVSVLSITRGIVSLTLRDDVIGAEQLPQLVQAASRLPLLQEFDITGPAITEWNDNCVAAWLDGFPSITDLYIDFDYIEDTGSLALRRHDRPLRKTQKVFLRWHSRTDEEEEAWASSLLSTLDPSTLLECEIYDSVVCPATFSWLGRCEYLAKLDIGSVPGNSAEILTELLFVLPKLLALQTFLVENNAELQGDPTEIDLALGQVLASCPPNLSYVSTYSVSFRDGEALPKIKGSVWGDEEHLVGRGFVRKPGRGERFWSLRSDRDGRWFRVAEDDDHHGEADENEDDDEDDEDDNEDDDEDEEEEEEGEGDADERRDPDDAEIDNFGSNDEDEEDENLGGSMDPSRDSAGDGGPSAVRAQTELLDGTIGAEVEIEALESDGMIPRRRSGDGEQEDEELVEIE
ncbi:hypothetical protein JCM3766R1_005449 [Sporobolomyces carnicolor]